MSYFSAKPKSTRTGMFLCEMSILAGLIMLMSTLKGSTTWMNPLDIIMNDASCVQEFDTREEEVEPVAGFGFFKLHRSQCWEVGPEQVIRSNNAKHVGWNK